MFAPSPTASGNKGSRRKGPSDDLPSASHSPHPSITAIPGHQATRSLHTLFEPALDGPPSPERIRAFSKQVKLQANGDKHKSQMTTSSGSSSLRSATSDRYSWDRSLENISLSRNASQRSTSAGVPSRDLKDRPESVQIFGKAIFQRRAKLRRGYSEQNTSSSSCSTEIPVDSGSVLPKDQHLFQAMFARRKTMKAEIEASQKKLHISGPYNFQHLTHTEKESLPGLESATSLDLASEFSSMRPLRTTDASMISIYPEDIHFANFSSESFHTHKDPSAGSTVKHDGSSSLAQSCQKRLPPTPPCPPGLTRRTTSQEKIRFAPPRPPRSPVEYTSPTSPIPPPPRTSSRASVCHEGFNSGFRQPQPFILQPTGSRPDPGSQVSSARIQTNGSEVVEQSALVHPPPDGAAWPLPNGLCSLPDVPEEEENHVIRGKSRVSIASNHSSLRGSVSVPLLRQISLSHGNARPPSTASDTLGKFDLFAAQRALRAGMQEEFMDDELDFDNWEDDIDYCYDHAAEANCDYAWERPSCDVSREDEVEDNRAPASDRSRGPIPSLLSPEMSDTPALSPASQISNATQQEAITPTVQAAPTTSNFSLPRRDSSAQLQRDSQPHSRASSFKESQGFNLSPTLLIPNDYHQQMLRYEREELRERELDDDFASFNFGKSMALSQARSSASTTDSAAFSTSTAFTRWTGSSSSSWQAHVDDLQNVVTKSPRENDHSFPKPTLVTLPESEQAVLPVSPLETASHARAQSDADLLVMGAPKSAKEPLKTRRRARTTSRSHNNAPPQFALFPQVGGRF
ncbi:hypothetical protein F5Y15DRAFT_414766 [Xylariaceae sp. FL0016]|nr:hypothetical protein F5Y15DRAFT_414766 [Xylariaceae sp. FL0016]